MIHEKIQPVVRTLKDEDWEKLRELFWEYCKTRNWINSHVKKFTLIEVLKQIEDKEIDED